MDSTAKASREKAAGRSHAPVFIVGSPRSGTTLLYDTLLSAGGFAIYLGESNIFNLLAPRFGDFRRRRNRERMLQAWLESRLFRVSGLKREEIEPRLTTAENAGDFLCIVMGEIARQQNAQRWADNTPEEILHLDEIKQTIPQALIIHIVRDGRDVALSLSERRFLRPFPWKDHESLEGAALYWEWLVQKGRTCGKEYGRDYMEVRFEDLVRNPQAVLKHLSAFLAQELDYERIQGTAIGSVARPNTSFTAQSQSGFNPVARWRRQFDSARLARIEGLIGPTLAALGYDLATQATAARHRLGLACTRYAYRRFFDFKLQCKINPAIRLLRPALTPQRIDEIVIVDDLAACSAGKAGRTIQAINSGLG